MRRLILGTAGHIDHGKTALVKALTGVDTDRLKEEKERGITVDLGFAEYQAGDEVLFGVVDVPGHEGFIRNMLAGATGMDLVLLVVAADEGVMPQTREHLSIVRLLGVPRLAVAVTKTDLVSEEWLELVEDDIRDLLAPTVYSGAPIVPVSSLTGEGIPDLEVALTRLGLEAEEKGTQDVPRLPIDRVFTIRGAGTIVTGTLWSGVLREGDKVNILPGDREGRVRSLQVHGDEVREAGAGARLAVGLTGSKIGHQDLSRGQTLVGGKGWEASWMLTCLITLLPDTGWDLEQWQRVRVHLGTAEVLARVALLESDRLLGGEEGWVQLRLEEPILARVRDHLVIRSYSPVTTLGGGLVAEALPRKRRRLAGGEAEALSQCLGDSPEIRLRGVSEIAGWDGVPTEDLPQVTGLSPGEIRSASVTLLESGGLAGVEDRVVARRIWETAKERMISSVSEFHDRHPLRPGIPLEELRQVLPGDFGPKLSEAVLQTLANDGTLRLKNGVAAAEGFRPSLSREQEELRDRLFKKISDAGMTPPSLRELEESEKGQAGAEGVLRLMEMEGRLLNLDGEYFFSPEAVRSAGQAVVQALGGSEGLGPADFREVLPLTRRHLLPLLRYFDLVGVTTRLGDSRKVARECPVGWGTFQGGEG